jgi:hypothetical protein
MKAPAKARLTVKKGFNPSKAATIGINYLGCTTLILVITGAASFFVAPDRAKDVWAVIGPLLGATIGAIAGVWGGRRSREV